MHHCRCNIAGRQVQNHRPACGSCMRQPATLRCSGSTTLSSQRSSKALIVSSLHDVILHPHVETCKQQALNCCSCASRYPSTTVAHAAVSHKIQKLFQILNLAVCSDSEHPRYGDGRLDTSIGNTARYELLAGAICRSPTTTERCCQQENVDNSNDCQHSLFVHHHALSMLSGHSAARKECGAHRHARMQAQVGCCW
jgi:hypothetical protein